MKYAIVVDEFGQIAAGSEFFGGRTEQDIKYVFNERYANYSHLHLKFISASYFLELTEYLASITCCEAKSAYKRCLMLDGVGIDGYEMVTWCSTI